MSPAELVICSLRSYLNTCACCGQVVLLEDAWQCSEMMPVSTADGNNHAYDLKIFSRAWKKRVSLKKQPKGRRWWWSLFYWTVCTVCDSSLPVLELHCHFTRLRSHMAVLSYLGTCWHPCLLCHHSSLSQVSFSSFAVLLLQLVSQNVC